MLLRLTLVCCALAALTGCGPAVPPADGRLRLGAAFYPMQYLADRVGGARVTVTNLTMPGAEPHDLELTPRQVAAVSVDDLVLYLRGFQPAVDAAVDAEAANTSLDLASVPGPQRGRTDEGFVIPAGTTADPHVWLEPLRFAGLGDAVADRLVQIDPEGAELYRSNAAGLRADLTTLDAEFRQGLADCTRVELVTSHDAFGYLARTYGLRQVAITGLTPDAEASSGRLAEIAQQVRADGVTTIFFEELVSPRVAQSLAREVGARAVELSPLEGPPRSGDYLSQMRLNLRTLQEALGCTTS